MRGSLTQLHVVYALLLRETKTRFGANQLGYLWALGQPILWIAMFAGLYYLIGRLVPPGMSVIAFLTTGIVPFSLFRETASRCVSAIASNKGLLFYPQVRPLDLVLARAVLEAATHVVVMAVLLGGMALYEGLPRVNSLLEVLAGLGLASALGFSLGLVCCGLSVYSPTVDRLFPIVARVLFWTCALFHPLESLPKKMRDIFLLNPLTHAIELVRDGWFPGYGARHVDVWYAMAWVLVLLFFGLSLERTARRSLMLS
ncbi:MAG TPA: ABC transporter permease [Polyangiaceae bacterium]|nr:ABC transporter permease [Polyangiaceae bacterium]